MRVAGRIPSVSTLRVPALVRAAAALLLLLAIAGDLALDSKCHPLTPASSGASVFAAGGEAEDDCADGCVSDCYCCSVLTATSMFRVGESDRPHVALVPASDAARASGVRQLPYRPPLLLS
jgi:hypothetical protein